MNCHSLMTSEPALLWKLGETFTTPALGSGSPTLASQLRELFMLRTVWQKPSDCALTEQVRRMTGETYAREAAVAHWALLGREPNSAKIF